MKYGRTWEALRLELPPFLQRSCLQYTQWKETIKAFVGPADVLLQQLEDDCERVSRAFTALARRRHRRRLLPRLLSAAGWCPCVAAVDRPCRAEDHNNKAFAELNRTSLYKICKKIDKRLRPSPRALEWMATRSRELRYPFLQGSELTSLVLTLPTDCPVCLDACDKIAISRCGHVLCLECLEDMYDMRGRKGTYHNLISARERASDRAITCPLCRKARPFSSMMFWPRTFPEQHRLVH